VGYYLGRMRTVFAAVADNPKLLCNSRGNPLFHFCFAVGNPRAVHVAMRIAKHILEHG